MIRMQSKWHPDRGAGTILNVGGPTNQNKCCGKSRGDQHIGGPPRF